MRYSLTPLNPNRKRVKYSNPVIHRTSRQIPLVLAHAYPLLPVKQKARFTDPCALLFLFNYLLISINLSQESIPYCI